MRQVEGKDSKMAEARTLLFSVGPALAIFTLVATVYVSYMKMGGWKWFSYHPAAMLVAYVGIAGNATLLKKVGGKENTQLHGLAMGACAVLAAFGWYVIYTNKNMSSKPHNTTWHAWLGVVVLVGYMSMAPVSWLAFNPTSGFLRRHGTARLIHKWVGRALTVAAWLSCALGWFTIIHDLWARVIFAIPLVLLAPLVFL